MCIRGGQFYYRRNVPKDAQGLIGRTEIWRSLRTDSLKAAVRRVHGVAAQIEAYIESARSSAGHSFDETLLRPFTDDPRPALAHAAAPLSEADSTSHPSIEVRPSIAAVTLGQAYEQYLNDPAHSWSARTRDAFETSRKMAVAVIGADTPLMTLSRAQCRDYIEVLRFLPRNAAKPRDDGAYTDRGYQKVVASDLSELRGFARRAGRADGSFSKACGHCQPE